MVDLKREIANEMHTPTRVNFPRRHTRIDGLRDLVQIDLIDLIAYKKGNKNFSYIMLAIDCFSKYIWCYPLKTKGSVEMTKVMQIFLKDYYRRYLSYPKHIQTDNGVEFYNKSVQNLFRNAKINHYSSYSNTKASIAERAIRTIKSKLFKEFSVIGKYTWVNLLQGIITNYNNTKHRTIKMAPSKVSQKNEKAVLFNIRASQNPLGRKSRLGRLQSADSSVGEVVAQRRKLLSVGDRVRISKYRNVFSKGYTPNFSEEVFVIDAVKSNSNPIVYYLRDRHGEVIKGGFYRYEIIKTNIPDDIYLVQKVLKRTKSKLYVLWSDGTRSWIDKKDVYTSLLKNA